MGGGGPSSLKFLPGMRLGGGVKFLIYFWRGGGGVPGNLETPLATPLNAMLKPLALSSPIGVPKRNRSCLPQSLNL